MIRCLIVISFLFLSSAVYSQIISSVSLSRDSIVIGDELEIYIELKSSKDVHNVKINYSSFDSIQIISDESVSDVAPDYAEIEFVTDNFDNNQPLNFKFEQGLYAYKDTLKARVWDTGILNIPHPIIKSGDASLRVDLLEYPFLFVSIPPNVVNPDTSSLILPIRDIIRENKNITDYLWLGYTLLAILAIALLFWIIRFRKKVVQTELPEEVSLPAHLTALDKLNALDNKKLWQKGNIKEFQSELTYIIREYIEARYNLPALESTSDEILNQLKTEAELGTSLLEELKHVLQIADLIKFAKAEPPEDIHQQFLSKAFEFVRHTKTQMTAEEELLIRKEYEGYLKKLSEFKIKNL